MYGRDFAKCKAVLTAVRPTVSGRHCCCRCFPGDNSIVTLPDTQTAQEMRCETILGFLAKAVGCPLT